MHPEYGVALWATVVWVLLLIFIRYSPIFTRVDGWVKRRVEYEKNLINPKYKASKEKSVKKSGKRESLSSRIRERQGL